MFKVTFSREALGKGAEIPSSRAFYALEAMLCTIGKEAGMGRTLLVDCGVGVLAARGRVMKFTFVQVTTGGFLMFLLNVGKTVPTGFRCSKNTTGTRKTTLTSGNKNKEPLHGGCWASYVTVYDSEVNAAQRKVCHTLDEA